MWCFYFFFREPLRKSTGDAPHRFLSCRIIIIISSGKYWQQGGAEPGRSTQKILHERFPGVSSLEPCIVYRKLDKDLKYFGLFLYQYGTKLIEFNERAFTYGGKHEFLVADTPYGPMRVCWYEGNVLDKLAFNLKQGVVSEYDAGEFLKKVAADKENNTYVCAATIDVFSQATRLYGTTVWKETASLERPEGTTQVSLRGSELLQDMLSRCPFYGIADEVMSPGSQMAQVANTTGLIGAGQQG